MKTQKHQLDFINNPGSRYKYRCKLCQQEWVTSPSSQCPGVRVFTSRDPKVCPEQYKPLDELKNKGLRPKKENHPSGAFKPSHHNDWEFLYDETEAIPIKLSDATLKVLKLGFKLFGWLVNAIAASILGVLVGLVPAPTSIPVFDFVLHHQLFSLIFICSVMLSTLIGLLIFFRLTSTNDQHLLHRHIHPWSLVTFTSTISFILCLSLLLVVLSRPPWCPSSLCPPPQRVLITHPHGIHDDNLEIYLIASQSASYVIPGDPAHYTQDNLPMNIAVLHTDGQNSMLLYHLVLGLNDLQQERFGMIIEEVDLVVQQVLPMPYPLNIWNAPSLTHYENDNQYRAVYIGQDAGAVMPAQYLRFQFGQVELAPGEQDQIDVHIISQVEANVLFSVQVIYRVSGDRPLHLLKLPQVFEVMFVDKSDWHLYRFQDGHFVASP